MVVQAREVNKAQVWQGKRKRTLFHIFTLATSVIPFHRPRLASPQRLGENSDGGGMDRLGLW